VVLLHLLGEAAVRRQKGKKAGDFVRLSRFLVAIQLLLSGSIASAV
jgi:hypothetical protein